MKTALEIKQATRERLQNCEGTFYLFNPIDQTTEEYIENCLGDCIAGNDYCNYGCTKEEDKDFFIPEYITGSDYSGSSATKANYNSFKEQFREIPGIVDISYGNSGYGIGLLLYFDYPEELYAVLEGLSNYPVIDEEAQALLEYELEQETLRNCYLSDFETLIYNHIAEESSEEERDYFLEGDDIEYLQPETEEFKQQLVEFFDIVLKENNAEWIHGTGNDCWISPSIDEWELSFSREALTTWGLTVPRTPTEQEVFERAKAALCNGSQGTLPLVDKSPYQETFDKLKCFVDMIQLDD